MLGKTGLVSVDLIKSGSLLYIVHCSLYIDQFPVGGRPNGMVHLLFVSACACELRDSSVVTALAGMPFSVAVGEDIKVLDLRE